MLARGLRLARACPSRRYTATGSSSRLQQQSASSATQPHWEQQQQQWPAAPSPPPSAADRLQAPPTRRSLSYTELEVHTTMAPAPLPDTAGLAFGAQVQFFHFLCAAFS